MLLHKLFPDDNNAPTTLDPSACTQRIAPTRPQDLNAKTFPPPFSRQKACPTQNIDFNMLFLPLHDTIYMFSELGLLKLIFKMTLSAIISVDVISEPDSLFESTPTMLSFWTYAALTRRFLLVKRIKLQVSIPILGYFDVFPPSTSTFAIWSPLARICRKYYIW